MGDEGAELDEVGFDIDRLDGPELELADARRVDDPPAAGQRDEFGHTGGVPPLAGIGTDGGCAETQAGLDDVEE